MKLFLRIIISIIAGLCILKAVGDNFVGIAWAILGVILIYLSGFFAGYFSRD